MIASNQGQEQPEQEEAKTPSNICEYEESTLSSQPPPNALLLLIEAVETGK